MYRVLIHRQLSFRGMAGCCGSIILRDQRQLLAGQVAACRFGLVFRGYFLSRLLVGTMCHLCVIAVFVAFAPFLRHTRIMPVASAPDRTERRNGLSFIGYKFFWLVSLPALAAQVWMIQLFGGIAGYISSLALSVVNFEGLGWLMSIIKTYSIINLVYFSFLVTRSKRKTRDVLIYGMHLLIFVVLALLTGSRGSLLVNFALMALIYHHSVRRISARWLFAFAVSAMLVASVLEVAREGVSFGENGLVTGLSEDKYNDKKMSFGWAKYGLIPLDLVLEADHVNMHYGFTYLTVFTNLIPRYIWPTKPEPGGNILTNEYAADQWGGTSFLSTGIMPEAIINFGRSMGIFVGALQFGALVGGLLLYYVRYRRRMVTNTPYKFIDSVRFAYISYAMMGLIIGEFTNIMVLLLIQLTTVWITQLLIRKFSKKSVYCDPVQRRTCTKLAPYARTL